MRARRRSKLAKTEVDPRFAESTAGGVPFVLTPEAVRAAVMPALGMSGMPASLEKSVPPAFRFWKADDLEAARSTRDALVESGLFTDSTIWNVDGEPTRIVTKHFVAEPEEVEVATLEARADAFALAERLIIGKAFDFRDREFDEVALAGVLSHVDGWGAVMKNDEKSVALAKSLGGMTFRVSTREDVIFVSKWAPRDESLVEVLASPVSKSARVRFLKAEDGLSAPVEERYVLGVVLEPETVDAQGDIYSPEEIRASAHNFLENYGAIGLQHTEIVTGKIKILESYIAPADFVIGGQSVKAGTWMLAVRVLDDAIWSGVKDGSYTGFSIGGSAVRTPVV